MRIPTGVREVITSPITEAYSWLDVLDHSERQRLLDVSQAVPGYPPPEPLRDAIALAVHEPATARYTEQLGLPALRSAVARSTNDLYGSSLEAQNVGIVSGCNQAFCLTLMAIAEPGDEIVLALPYYFNHDMWIRLQGLEPIYVPTDDRFLPDPERTAAAITDRTRAIVLITPNNPTGAVYPPELLDDFYRLAAERGTTLILDETYRDFRSVTTAPHCLLQGDAWHEHLVQLYSFSKAFCLTGYRVGAIVTTPGLLEEIAKVMDCVAICPPHIGQIAALRGLEMLDDWKESNRRKMNRRLEAFLNQMTAAESAFRVRAAGAYFAYVEHPFEGEGSTSVARRLAQQGGVLALSGEMFGPGQEPYLRLAFANLDDDKLPELVQRLTGFCR